METASSTSQEVPPLGDASRRLGRRLVAIFENRFHLLLVEAEEEREHILRAIKMIILAAAFSLLAGITLGILVAVAFWNYYPVVALLILLAIYVVVAGLCYARFLRIERNWQVLPATIEQLKKDRECLEKQLS